MNKFEVSYSLPNRDYVTIGVEANDAASAVEKVKAAFDDATLWDDLPHMPILDDDYEEDGDAGEALAFECKEVNAFVVRPSMLEERRLQAAQRACAALMDAFANRTPSDPMTWCDSEPAFALALAACGKESAGHTGADAEPPRTYAGSGASANPCANDEVAVGTPGRLVTLEGVAIQGTLESLSGVAGTTSAVRTEDGSLDVDYEGGTKVCWDEQRTLKTPAGEVIFVTETGHEVPANQIKLVSGN